eukprot:3941494-Rhodomonas_salina.1
MPSPPKNNNNNAPTDEAQFKVSYPPVFDPSTPLGIKDAIAFFDTEGFVLLRVFDQKSLHQTAKPFVLDQIKNIIQAQPLNDQFKLVHHPEFHPDIPTDDDELYDYFTQPFDPSSSTTRKRSREWEDVNPLLPPLTSNHPACPNHRARARARSLTHDSRLTHSHSRLTHSRLTTHSLTLTTHCRDGPGTAASARAATPPPSTRSTSGIFARTSTCTTLPPPAWAPPGSGLTSTARSPRCP